MQQEDMHEDEPEESGPLYECLLALESVAKGGPMTSVQSTVTSVVKVMSKQEADEFTVQVRRLKEASERLYQMVFEASVSKV